MLLIVSTGKVLGTDPSPDTSNTTKPLTRAQIMAMTPEETDAKNIADDPAFQVCNSGKTDSSECQDAMTRKLAEMTQTHQDIVSDLTNIAVQLNSINTQQAVGDRKITDINTAIYGSGNDDNIGLVNSLSKVANGLQDIQNTVRDRSADIANKSSTVRSSTDSKIKNVRTVMDSKLADVEKQINTLLNDQAKTQQTALVNSATNMQQAAQAASNSIANNAKALQKSATALSDAADILEEEVTSGLTEVAKTAENTNQNIAAIKDSAKDSLSQLKDTMTEETKKAINDAVQQGKSSLSASASDAQQKLLDAKNQALADVSSAQASLQSDVQNLKADTLAKLQDTQNKMKDAQTTNQNSVNAVTSQVNVGTSALSTAQQESAKNVGADAQLSRDEMNKLMELISAFKKSTTDSVGSIRDQVHALASPMQQSVADQLKGQGTATGDELLRMNSQIGDVLSRIKGQGSDAQASLMNYLANIQKQAGSDAKSQQGALSDAQATIDLAKALADGQLKLESDKASSAASVLFKMFGTTLDDTTQTVNDVNNAHSAKQLQLQRQFQQAILDQQSGLTTQVNRAKFDQQQGLNELQSDQAEKSRDISAIIAQLSGVFNDVDSSSKYSQSAIEALKGKLSNSQGIADSELARMVKLMEQSQAAANAGAAGANSKIQFAMQGMSDQLSGTLKQYASQFNGDFSRAISRLTGLSDSTLQKLQRSGDIQRNTTSDAETLAKTLLTDLQKLQQTGSSESDALGDLFKSQSMAAGLKRQAKMKGVADDAQQQLSGLEGSIMDMIQGQTNGLASSTSESVNNQKSQLSHLIDILRAQQIDATRLATLTQGALDNVGTWTRDMSGQISSAQMKATDAKQIQLLMIQALQDELATWSSTLDKNISDVRAQLQEGMSMIPNVTAAKAADTEELFSTSNEQMQKYLSILKTAFDNMRNTEANYVKQQSLRRFASLVGIDRASLDNSNVLMQLVGVSDLSQLGNSQQIATVLAGLADGVQALQKKDGDAYTSLRENINHLDSNSKGLFGQLMNKATGSLLGLYDKYADDQHQLLMTIEAASDKDSLRAQALDDALNGMLGSIRNGSFVLNGQLASDRKDLYGLDGSVRQLGDEASLALSRLLRSAEAQSTAADSALAMSQKVNADRVASVRDVVISFVRAMEEYVNDSRHGFDDIHDKLKSYKGLLENKLTTSDQFMLQMAQSTQSGLTAVTSMADAFQNRVDAFNNRAKQQLFNLQEERSQLQSRHEVEINELKQKLTSAQTQIKDDQDSISQQIDYWLNEEDVDLGFVTKNVTTSTTTAASGNTTAAAAALPGRTSSFLETRKWSSPVHSHDVSREELMDDVRDNLDRIHEEARTIGIMV